MILRASILLSCVLSGTLAQQPATPASADPGLVYPQTFLGAGASYNSQASPRTVGWLAFAQLINKSGTYSYSVVDLSVQAHSKPQTAVETGVAQFIRDIGTARLYGLAAAGAAIAGTTTGNATTGAFTGGALLVVPIKSGWSFVPSVRILKVNGTASQASIGLGFGYSR